MEKEHIFRIKTQPIMNKGFTLSELMIAAAILIIALSGIISLFLNCSRLGELDRGQNSAVLALQTKMEEIKNTTYSSLDSLGNTTFDLNGFSSANAKGRIEVTNQSDHLKKIRVVASFKSGSRTIGEDVNFNGILNSGEDANSNGQLDSPFELVTLISE